MPCGTSGIGAAIPLVSEVDLIQIKFYRPNRFMWRSFAMHHHFEGSGRIKRKEERYGKEEEGKEQIEGYVSLV